MSITTTQLATRVQAYAERAGLTEITASGRVFNDGKRLAALLKGSRMWPTTLDAAVDKLDALEAELKNEAA